MASYEFNAEEEVTFRSLAIFMLIGSVLFFLTAIISFITVFTIGNGAVFFLIFSMIMLMMGLTFALPIDNFRRIIRTQKNDIKELLDAFAEIRFVWTVAAAVIITYRIFVFFTIL